MNRYWIVVFTLITSHLFAQREFIVEIFSEEGTFKKVSPAVDDVAYIFPGMNTYDDNSGTFYFISSGPKENLYGISVEEQEVVSSVDANGLRSPEYSNSLDKLFGIISDQNSDTKTFVSFDSESGRVEQGEVISGSSTYQGYDAFNDKDQIYTFTSPPGILYSFDANTMALLYEPPIVLPTGHGIQHYQYDNTNGNLYGVVAGPNDLFYLVSIDIETARFTKIGEDIETQFRGGSGTIDEKNQRYICHASDQLLILDLISGEVLSHTFIEGLDDRDNLFDIEYDNQRNRLFSKHWDAMISSTTDQSAELIHVFPTVATDMLFIETNLNLNEYRINMINANGIEVNCGHLLADNLLDVSCLPNGIYNLVFRQTNESTLTKQIIISR